MECDWDADKAYDALRKKGLAAAAKKASRHAAEGLVGLAVARGGVGVGPAVAVVEVNSETDFVARGDIFRNLVSHVAQAALRMRGSDQGRQGLLDKVRWDVPAFSLSTLCVSCFHPLPCAAARLAHPRR